MITAAVLWLAVTPGLADAGVDASGQFTTDVAIKVPSYHGLQPGLALHYQSGGPDGWVGVGWTLQGTSTITRQSGVHGLPTWIDADDHYAIDGMDLIACAGASARVQASPSCAHPVSGTVAYTTTVESYKRIAFTQNGSGGIWTVWNPDGVTATYRPVTTTGSGVLDWRTSSIQDLSGNTVNYHWTTAAGQEPELSSITYGDPSGVDGQTVISFKTESRPDPITTATATATATGSSLLVQSDRLAEIDETADGQPVRSYRLKYIVHNGRSHESFLQRVRQFGSDGTTALPATRFGKTPGHTTTDWLPQTGSSLTGLASDWPTGPADATRWDETLNGGPQGTLDWPAPKDGHASWLSGDLNRDERQDVLQVQPDSDGSSIDVQAEMNRDDGGYSDVPSQLSFNWPTDPNAEPGQTDAQQTTSDVSVATPELADVNGDGYPDLVIVVKESNAYYAGVALNQQNGQFVVANDGAVTAVASPGPNTGGGVPNTAFATGDVTGNGRADLIAETSTDSTNCPDSQPSLTTWFSNGQGGLTAGPTTCWPASLGNHGILADLQAVDLNGDLKTDLAGYQPASTPDVGLPTQRALVWTAVATGDGRFTTNVFDTGQSWETDQSLGLIDGCAPPDADDSTQWKCAVDADQPAVWGDFDGDHRTDLAVLTQGSGDTISAHILRSDGTGSFKPADTWSTTLPNAALQTYRPCLEKSTDSHCDSAGDPRKTADEIVTGDFDGDGQSDLAALTQSRNNSTVDAATEMLDNEHDGFGSAPTGTATGTSNTTTTTAVDWRSANCKTVTECGSPVVITGDSNADGRDDIIAVDGDQTSAALASVISPAGPRLDGLLSGDVNGDGLTDQVSVAMSSDNDVQVRSYLGAANGDLKPVAAVDVPVANAYLKHLPADQWQLADVNGDHLADLINLPYGARYGVELLATPSHGWNEQVITLTGLDRTSSSSGGTTLVCERKEPGVPLHCHPVTTTTTTDTEPAVLPRTGSWQIGDVTGDGIPDLVHVGGAAPWDDPGVLVLAGSRSGTLSTDWTKASDSAGGPNLRDPLGWRLADVNGDGSDDLVKVDTTPGSGEIYTLVSHGEKWTPSEQPLKISVTATPDKPCGDTGESSILTTGGDDPAWTPLDINGDGAEDLARVVIVPNTYPARHSELCVQELISLGNGQWQTEDPTPIDPSTLGIDTQADPDVLSGADNENWQAADVNLDGRGDLVKATESAGVLHVQMLLPGWTVRPDGVRVAWWRAQQQTIPIPSGSGGGPWTINSDRGAITLTDPSDLTGNGLRTVQSDVLPDAIASTANGLGARTTIAYAHGSSYSAADTPDAQCRAPEGSLPYLVTGLNTQVNDIGLQPVTAIFGGKRQTGLRVEPSTPVSDSSSVRYACPRYSDPLRSFQGWTDSWTTHDAAQNPVTGGTGRPGSIEHVTRTIDGSGIQQTTQDETTTLDGTPLQQSNTTYQPVGDGPPYVDLPTHVVSGDCDTAGCTASKKTISYDVNGNVVDEFDSASGSGLQRETTTTYDDNDQLWLHGLPRLTDVYAPAHSRLPTEHRLRRPLTAALDCYDGDTSPQCDQPAGPNARGLVTTIRQLRAYPQKWVTTQAYTYDQYGNQASATDADGHTSTIKYDADGLFPVRACNALKQPQCTSTGSYDRVAEAPTSKTAITGATTTTGFDPLGRPIRTVGPTGLTTTIAYKTGAFGTRTISTQAAGGQDRLSRTLTDGLGRTIRTRTSGIGHQVSETDTEYLDGKLVAASTAPHAVSQDPADWTSTDYDALSRPVATHNADGSTSTVSYAVDHDYDTTHSIDADGKDPTTRYTDGWGDLTKVQQPSVRKKGATATVRYAYNPLGEQTKVTDPHGNSETTTWSMLGNKIADSDPDRGRETYQYDPAGNLLRSRDARGRAVTYTYDALGRLHTKTDHATHQTSTWTYGNTTGLTAGRLISVSDPSATGCKNRLSHTYSYDLLGDVTREISCVDGVTGTTSMRFNTFGQAVRTTYPDHLVVRTFYNRAGQLDGVSRYLRSVTYNPEGQIATARFDNSTRATNAYDPRRDSLTRQTLTRTSGKHRLLFAESYAYDDAGHVISRASSTNGEQHHYGYNILGELTTVRDGAAAKVLQRLSYDDLGDLRTNSTVGTYKYPEARVCTKTGCVGPEEARTVGNRRYTYDKSGDVIREQQGNQSTTMSWTTDGMLSQLDGPGDTVSRTYDADETLVAEHDEHGTTVFINGLAQRTPAGWTDDIYAIGNLIATQTRNTRTWYAVDEQDSTRALLNRAGDVIARSNYGTFGAPVSTNTAARFGYTGAQSIGSSGLLDLQARDFDPSTGRFLSADTVTVSDTPLGINRYEYSANDPATLTDPTGHDWLQAAPAPSWAVLTPNGGFDPYTGLGSVTAQLQLNWAIPNDLSNANLVNVRPQTPAKTPTATQTSSASQTTGGTTGSGCAMTSAGPQCWEEIAVVASTTATDTTQSQWSPPPQLPYDEVIRNAMASDARAAAREVAAAAFAQRQEALCQSIGCIRNVDSRPDPGIFTPVQEQIFEETIAPYIITGGAGLAVQEEDLLAQAAADARIELNVGARRNIAVASYDIDGASDELVAVSGEADRPGTVGLPTDPQFDPVVGSVSRPLDSEYKILESIAAATDSESTGVVEIYSEREPCAACSSVIDQFRAARPGIQLIVRSGANP